MKTNIRYSELSAAVGAVKKAVPGRTTLGTLKNIRFDFEANLLTLTTTDCDIFAVAEVHCSSIETPAISFLVDMKLLEQVLKTLKPKKSISPTYLDIEIDDSISSMSVNSFSLAIDSNMENFPEVTDVEPNVRLYPLPEQWDNIVDALNYVSNDMTRPALCGLNFSRSAVVGTNGCILKKIACDHSYLEDKNFTVPTKALRCAAKLSAVNIGFAFGEKVISHAFICGDVTNDVSVVYITRCITEMYPNVDRVIPTESHPALCIRDKTRLAKVVHQALVAAPDKDSRAHDRIEFNLSSNGSGQYLAASNSESGLKFNQTIDASWSGDDMQVGVNGRYLLTCMQTLPDDYIAMEIDTPERALLFRDGVNTLLLMPVRAGN